MEHLRIIFIIWLRDIIRYWRNRARMILSLAMPLLWLIMFGSGMKGSISMAGTGFGGADFDYITFLFPGVIGMSILFTSIFSAITIVTDREFGFLKEVMVAPISRTSVAVGKILGGSTVALIQGMIMLFLSPIVGVKLSLGLILGLIPVMFLTAFSLTSMGILVASRMKSTEGFQMVMNFLMMPMFFLSGALFPLVNLPGWMSFLAKINPASYGIDIIRQVTFSFLKVPSNVADTFKISLFNQSVGLLLDAAIIGAFGLVMVFLAVLAFNKVEK